MLHRLKRERAKVVHNVLHFDLQAPGRLPEGQHEWDPDWGNLLLEVPEMRPGN